MSARESNPIYIMEQVIENNFPSITKGWANYVVNEIINQLHSKGFDIAKMEVLPNKEEEIDTMKVYYVSESFCYHEDENIPNDLFWSATGTKQIHACSKNEARKLYEHFK